MDSLFVKITIGIVSLIIAITGVWFIYSKFFGTKTQNLEFSEPHEDVTMFNIPIAKPHMITGEKISELTEENKTLKLDKTYKFVEPQSFNLQIEGKSITAQFANNVGELIGTLSVEKNGNAVFNNVEYPNMVKEGDKIYTISMIDKTLFINSIKIQELYDRVSSFRLSGEVKSVKYYKH